MVIEKIAIKNADEKIVLKMRYESVENRNIHLIK